MEEVIAVFVQLVSLECERARCWGLPIVIKLLRYDKQASRYTERNSVYIADKHLAVLVFLLEFVRYLYKDCA